MLNNSEWAGTRIDDRYRIDRLLGAGGMAHVYLGHDDRLDRPVAIKIPRAEYLHDSEFRRRFFSEGRRLARLEHRNIVTVYDAGEWNGNPYLVMKYVDGHSLAQRRSQGGPAVRLPDLKWLLPIAESLDYIHGQGVIHRDVKPGNILLDRSGSPYLSDFGISKAYQRDTSQSTLFTEEGKLLMTPEYASPEHFLGEELDGRSDQYSLGVLVYDLLAGRPPFTSTNPFVLATKHLKEEAPRLEDLQLSLPESSSKAVMRALSKTRGARYDTCVDFVSEFLKGLASRSPQVQDFPPPPCVAGNRDVTITNSIGMTLTLIRAGEFLMGSPKEEGQQDEHPQHPVEISSPFYLGVHAVTQHEYARVVGQNPSWFCARGGGKAKVAGLDTGRYPVENVSWDEAQEFCRRLTTKEGRMYRLPTEAEWEYACRAGARGTFCFGNDEKQLEHYAWHIGNSGEKTQACGQELANAFGLFDMHGNVWEWVADWYESQFYEWSPTNDPLGPEQGPQHVVRGGCWCSNPTFCRSAVRFINPESRNYRVGFRVCRESND